MSTASTASSERFARLAEQLAGSDGSKGPHRVGFGTGSLFVGRKMFGLLGDSGALVLKLPPARVQALIDEGTGKGWHPGAGAPLKEYVAIGLQDHAKWLRLAQESRAYMAAKG
ncbi:MAG: MmcQ/YjbR family DNA-binding protein [Thermoplasmata archaeon]|nr:MmcQ/YjbR family DNA-binding protein [Thermoplasmata archaeon]